MNPESTNQCEHKDIKDINNILVNIHEINVSHAGITQLRLARRELEALERLERTPLNMVKINGVEAKYADITQLRLAIMQVDTFFEMKTEPFNKVEQKYIIIDGNLLVGLTIDEAKHRYPGIKIREYKIDDKPIFVTADYRHDRHNVETENGIITRYVRNG